MYKKYLKTTFLIVFFLIAVIVNINLFVDPGKIYLKKIVLETKANEYIKKLLNSDYGLFRRGWNERLVKQALAKQAGSHQCVILGSSHIMQISSIQKIGNIQTQCKSLLNLGVSGGSLEDIFIFSSILFQNDKLPQKVFIDIDPWTLKFNMDSRYGASIDEYVYMNELLGIKKNIVTSTYTEKVLKNLMNWEYFYSSIQMLKDKQGKVFEYFKQKGYAPIKPYKYSEGSLDSIILADGGHIYSNSYIIKQKKENPNIPIGGGNYKISGEVYNIVALTNIEKLLKFYQSKNIEISLILTPYHPNVFKKGKTKTVKHIEKVKSIVLHMANKYSIKVYGSFSPNEIKCNENEFLDFMHPTIDCLNKIDFSH